MTGPIRAARRADVPVLLELIRDLAAYEREPDAVHASADLIAEALFGATPAASCHVAQVDGQVVGFALWFPTFSTWTGRAGLWLEDLFVRPEHRGSGHGLALLAQLAQVCLDRGWTRFEWWVLDWNDSARGFYRSVGALPKEEWTTWRLEGPALQALAGRLPPSPGPGRAGARHDAGSP